MTLPRKLSDEQYRQILAAYAGTETARSIARRFGVCDSTIFRIARRFGIPFKGHRNKRQQIIKLSLEHPELGPAAIAKLLGAHKHYVQNVRRWTGLKTPRKRKNIAPVVAPTTHQGGLQSELR